MLVCKHGIVGMFTTVTILVYWASMQTFANNLNNITWQTNISIPRATLLAWLIMQMILKQECGCLGLFYIMNRYTFCAYGSRTMCEMRLTQNKL